MPIASSAIVKSVRTSFTHTQTTEASRPGTMAQERPKESSCSSMLLNHIGSAGMFVCTDLQGTRHCVWDTFPPQAGRKSKGPPRGEGALHPVWDARVSTGIRLLNCSLLGKHLASHVREMASSRCHAESPALVSGDW